MVEFFDNKTGQWKIGKITEIFKKKLIKLRPLSKIKKDKLFYQNPKYTFVEISENEKVLLKHG